MTDTAQGPVLVPVDFSPFSEAALAWAANYSKTSGAALIVLHVVHDPVDDPGHYAKLLEQAGTTDDAELQPIEQAAEAVMENFLRDAAVHHPELGDPGELDTRLVVGVPTSRILEVIDSCGARLVVMGSHGRTGLGHLLLGSKAEEIVRQSPVPVTIVKAPRAESGDTPDSGEAS